MDGDMPGDKVDVEVVEGNVVICDGRVNVVSAVVANIVVIVVVGVVSVGTVGITIGTIIPVRIRLTTVFNNGYGP
jgi:hypothetical protein